MSAPAASMPVSYLYFLPTRRAFDIIHMGRDQLTIDVRG